MWGQECYDLSVIQKKKVVGARRAHASKWKALAPFERRVRLLPVVVSGLQRRHPKCHVALHTVGQHMSSFVAQRSSSKKFSPTLFSLSSISKDVLTLQSCKMVLNLLIVSNLIYLFFNFIH